MGRLVRHAGQLPAPLTHAPRGALLAYQQRPWGAFIPPPARASARVPPARRGPVRSPSSQSAPRLVLASWTPLSLLRHSPRAICKVGPESSLTRSKLQVFAQFRRAMCPFLPKSPIVMRHVESLKSNSLSVEIKLKLRICPINCQKSPKII